MLRYYYYQLLNEQNKQAYRIIDEAVHYFESSVKVGFPFNYDEVMSALTLDEPKYYYVDWRKCKAVEGADGAKDVELFYLMDKKQNKKARSVFNKLVDRLCVSDDNWKNLLSLHNFVIRLIMDQETIERLPEPLVQSFRVDGGSAKLFQVLAECLHIECALIKGRVIDSQQLKTDYWNIVCVNGKCYHIDVKGDYSLSCVSESIRYDYFMLSDAEIVKSRYILHPFGCNFDDSNYFVKNNLLAESYEDISRIIDSQSAPINSLYFKRINQLALVDREELLASVNELLTNKIGVELAVSVFDNPKHDIFYLSISTLLDTVKE